MSEINSIEDCIEEFEKMDWPERFITTVLPLMLVGFTTITFFALSVNYTANNGLLSSVFAFAQCMIFLSLLIISYPIVFGGIQQIADLRM